MNDLLLNIIKNENDSNYEFVTNDIKLDENKNIQSRNNCWFVFKKTKTEESDKYKIKQGDILRFGRIITRIKEIKINKLLNISKNVGYNLSNKIINDISSFKEKEPQNSNNNNNESKKNPLRFSIDFSKINQSIRLTNNKNKNSGEILKTTTISVSKSLKKIQKNKLPKICRICYGEEEPDSDFDNPLVQPCNCSGSLRFIHLNCLKTWLNTKSCNKILSNSNYSMFLVRSVECEICKTKFPDFVKHKEMFYEILDFKSEFENYFTMESLTIDKNNTKCIYVVNLDKNVKLKIGRGHDSNLVLSDISVSRVHSIFTIENKNIYIEDNNSKFGTLILIQSHTLKLIENLPLYIQVGRSFLDCRIKKPSKAFSCCGASVVPNFNFYYLQNENQNQEELLNMLTIKPDIDFSEDYDSSVIEEKEKDLDKKKLQNEQNIIKNNRYEENTIDVDNININETKREYENISKINSSKIKSRFKDKNNEKKSDNLINEN